MRPVKTLEQAERRGRGHSLVVPSSPSAVRMRAVVEGRNFLGAAQGCSADDDKGIAAAVMCSDLERSTPIHSIGTTRTGRRSTTRAVASMAANVGGGNNIYGALRISSELPFGDVMLSVSSIVWRWQEVLWPIVFALVPEQPNETGFARAPTARRHCSLCFGRR